jgi:hypothetical protein
MRGVLKLAAALAIVATSALGLVACGGGDSTDSTGSTDASSTGTTAETTGTTTGEDRGQGQGEKESDDDSGGSGQGSDDSGGGSHSADEGSAEFRVPGGDNSIQNYGDEAATTEREEANDVLTEYLDARAAGDWAKQCALLAESSVAPLEQLASRSPRLKGKGCPTVLKALSASASKSARVSTLTGSIASLRVEGDRGFVLYHGPKGVDYFVPMVKEDGVWKVAAIAPTEFLG